MTFPGPIRKLPEIELPLRKLEKCSPSSGLIHTPTLHPTPSTKPSKMQAGYISVPTWSITWVLLCGQNLRDHVCRGPDQGVLIDQENHRCSQPLDSQRVILRSPSGTRALSLLWIKGEKTHLQGLGQIFLFVFFSLASLISEELSQIQL